MHACIVQINRNRHRCLSVAWCNWDLQLIFFNSPCRCARYSTLQLRPAKMRKRRTRHSHEKTVSGPPRTSNQWIECKKGSGGRGGVMNSLALAINASCLCQQATGTPCSIYLLLRRTTYKTLVIAKEIKTCKLRKSGFCIWTYFTGDWTSIAIGWMSRTKQVTVPCWSNQEICAKQSH